MRPLPDFAEDGRTLVSAGYDRVVRYWDTGASLLGGRGRRYFFCFFEVHVLRVVRYWGLGMHLVSLFFGGLFFLEAGLDWIHTGVRWASFTPLLQASFDVCSGNS